MKDKNHSMGSLTNLSLRVIEISRDRYYGILHRLTQVRLCRCQNMIGTFCDDQVSLTCCLLHLDKHKCPHLTRGVYFAICFSLHPSISIRRSYYFKRNCLGFLLNLFVVKASAYQTLGGIQCVFGVRNSLLKIHDKENIVSVWKALSVCGCKIPSQKTM